MVPWHSDHKKKVSNTKGFQMYTTTHIIIITITIIIIIIIIIIISLRTRWKIIINNSIFVSGLE